MNRRLGPEVRSETVAHRQVHKCGGDKLNTPDVCHERDFQISVQTDMACGNYLEARRKVQSLKPGVLRVGIVAAVDSAE